MYDKAEKEVAVVEKVKSVVCAENNNFQSILTSFSVTKETKISSKLKRKPLAYKS